jgi:trigger factor
VNDTVHSVKIEDLSTVKKRLSFDIPWLDVKKELDSAYREVGKHAKVKGFRLGKTPRPVLETYFKAEAEEQAVSHMVSKALWGAVEQNNISPLSKPVVDQNGIEKEKDFSFTVTMEVKPSFEPKDYLGIEVNKEELRVTEEDVSERLDHLRQRYGTLEDLKEERGLAEGDFADIDFEGNLDGVTRPELKAENYLLEIGSKRFVPGFEEQLIGVKIGESRNIQVTFPDDYPVKDLAGKEVAFSVAIKGIKIKIVPPLDDNFIKNFEKYETLDDIRADIRKSLEEEKSAGIRSELTKAIIDKLIEHNPIEAPEILVERQIYSMMMEAQRRMAMNGMDPKQAMDLSARMHDRFKDDAEKSVKASLILAGIAERESITVEDKDVDEKLEKIAGRYGEDKESVKKLYEKDDMIEELKAEIKEEKTLDFVEGKARIKSVTTANGA